MYMYILIEVFMFCFGGYDFFFKLVLYNRMPLIKSIIQKVRGIFKVKNLISLVVDVFRCHPEGSNTTLHPTAKKDNFRLPSVQMAHATSSAHNPVSIYRN